MSELKVNTITNAAGGNTAQINGMTPTADSLQGFRNRIINGDMRINQRAATATINSGSYTYAVDRWAGIGQAADGVFTLQSSTVAPTGFQNSLLATVTTADASLAAGQFYAVRQAIEGFNFADLSWGTASASAITLSFWVQSSLTGTFGGSIRNLAANRSYPFTYAISAANTWEQKTITVAGDITGTWETGSSTGAEVFFALGVGSTFSGTAGAWAGSNFLSATGAVSVIGTLSATWQITGVQLEAGSVATPFERRPYGTEFNLCERYFRLNRSGLFGQWEEVSNTTFYTQGLFYADMRAVPTPALVNATNAITRPGVANYTPTTIAYSGTGGRFLSFTTPAAGVGLGAWVGINLLSFSAEL
jgi:hypothetical protein